MNGSFEEGPDTPNDGVHNIALEKGSTAVTGWVLTETIAGPIDSAYWRHVHGKRSFALAWNQGATQGSSASQDFKTTKGQKYRVAFWMAGDPLSGPKEKKLRVSAAGKSTEFVFDTTGKNRVEMGWVSKSWEFTAEADETTLEFSCLSEGMFGGVVFDDMVVAAVDA